MTECDYFHCWSGIRWFDCCAATQASERFGDLLEARYRVGGHTFTEIRDDGV